MYLSFQLLRIGQAFQTKGSGARTSLRTGMQTTVGTNVRARNILRPLPPGRYHTLFPYPVRERNAGKADSRRKTIDSFWVRASKSLLMDFSGKRHALPGGPTSYGGAGPEKSAGEKVEKNRALLPICRDSNSSPVLCSGLCAGPKPQPQG
jgi:hypothetical protein